MANINILYKSQNIFQIKHTGNKTMLQDCTFPKDYSYTRCFTTDDTIKQTHFTVLLCKTV